MENRAALRHQTLRVVPTFLGHFRAKIAWIPFSSGADVGQPAMKPK